MLENLGATLIDADQIARDVTGPQGAAIAAIKATFGAVFVDGTGALDRSRMRQLVFSQPNARAQLEAIVHPLVAQHSQLMAHQASLSGAHLVVFDIPLLVESRRWPRQLDAVVVVDCATETQIVRVMRRSGLERAVVEGIIASQASRGARRAVADIVIANDADCTLEELRNRASQTASLFGL
jgi:dephospho-CoA kinase